MKTPPYTVIFDSEEIIAVDKRSGLSVGGDRWDDSQERLDRLIAAGMGYAKLWTVHRIDKETSGVVVFAKDRETHRRLCLAFEARQVAKRYIAVVHGRPSWKETSCDLALVPNGNKKHMTIVDKYRGKKSLTSFTVIAGAGNYSVLEARPLTGRIHQIRVHAAAIGHPVVCDALYGKEAPVLLSSFKRGYKGDLLEENPLLARLGLHALELSLPGAQVLSAPLPRDMRSLVRQIEMAGRSFAGRGERSLSGQQV